MALLSNINFYFDCKTRLCHIVPGRQEKVYFAQESFYLQGILNDINEQDTFFLDFKHKHMITSGAPPDKFTVLTIWLPIEFHGFTSRINSKGYHSLIPGLISIFLEMVWVPLMSTQEGSFVFRGEQGQLNHISHFRLLFTNHLLNLKEIL